MLLVGDTQQTISNPANLNDLLFGDCGSATLLEYDKDGFGLRFELQTIGSGFKYLGATSGLRFACVNHPTSHPSVYMDGLNVFNFSITQVPQLFKSFLNAFDEQIENYDSVFLHQANKSMLKIITKKIKATKAPMCLEKYGNTASASVPNVMCDHYANDHSKELTKVILSGFGIGLSLGIADAYICPNDIFPIISTDITWDEGREKVLNSHAKS